MPLSYRIYCINGETVWKSTETKKNEPALDMVIVGICIIFYFVFVHTNAVKIRGVSVWHTHTVWKSVCVCLRVIFFWSILPVHEFLFEMNWNLSSFVVSHSHPYNLNEQFSVSLEMLIWIPNGNLDEFPKIHALRLGIIKHLQSMPDKHIIHIQKQRKKHIPKAPFIKPSFLQKKQQVIIHKSDKIQ